MAKASLILVMALSLSIISLFGVVKALHADLIHNNLPDEDDGGQIDKVNAATGEVSMMGTTSHVFTFFLAPHYFNWTDPSNGMDKDLVRYRATLLDRPSLPPWLKYRHSSRHKAGLIYGVPPTAGLTIIQVVATNRHTFQTGQLVLNIHVENELVLPQSEVQLKIDNLNIEDIFDKHRIQRLMEIFKQRFWLEAFEDIHLTFADSAIELGGRRPLKPTHKDGVVVHLGSGANFSEPLLALDSETQPLRNHKTCSYKRISVERYFRQAGFAIDWCSFRLITQRDNVEDKTTKPIKTFKMGDKSSDWHFPKRGDMKRESKLAEILTAMVVPIIILALFSAGLGFLLWSDCNSEKQTSNVFVDSLFEVFYDCVPSGENHSQQMIISNNNNSSMDITTSKPSLVPSSSPDLRTSTPNTHRNLRASSVQRQSDTLRSLAKKRDVAQHLHATPPTSLEGSSLHSRSRTGSPCPSTTCGSPVQRQSFNWDMFETLNRPNPPAYGNSLPRGIMAEDMREDGLTRQYLV
eukprot:TRINITY_DN8230_c0_g1_i2.p1 TRINITY_DN8230_c0_g1~~TRINITY_DN8230_c0_g1_i2.p1  ORF type:complete len:520 (-),score=103.32 TRINITY_DN8230_c0_g1_i2:388-1947(-)